MPLIRPPRVSDPHSLTPEHHALIPIGVVVEVAAEADLGKELLPTTPQIDADTFYELLPIHPSFDYAIRAVTVQLDVNLNHVPCTVPDPIRKPRLTVTSVAKSRTFDGLSLLP